VATGTTVAGVGLIRNRPGKVTVKKRAKKGNPVRRKCNLTDKAVSRKTGPDCGEKREKVPGGGLLV